MDERVLRRPGGHPRVLLPQLQGVPVRVEDLGPGQQREAIGRHRRGDFMRLIFRRAIWTFSWTPGTCTWGRGIKTRSARSSS
jgi:hypothetical protein